MGAQTNKTMTCIRDIATAIQSARPDLGRADLRASSDRKKSESARLYGTDDQLSAWNHVGVFPGGAAM